MDIQCSRREDEDDEEGRNKRKSQISEALKQSDANEPSIPLIYSNMKSMRQIREVLVSFNIHPLARLA